MAKRWVDTQLSGWLPRIPKVINFIIPVLRPV